MNSKLVDHYVSLFIKTGVLKLDPLASDIEAGREKYLSQADEQKLFGNLLKISRLRRTLESIENKDKYHGLYLD